MNLTCSAMNRQGATAPRRSSLVILLLLITGVDAGEVSLRNPTKREVTREPVRIALTQPGEIAEDGQPIPSQLVETDGKSERWALVSLPPLAARAYTVVAARIDPAVDVQLTDANGAMDLSNRYCAVRLAGSASPGQEPGANVPGAEAAPLLAVRLADGRWVGKGAWKTLRDQSAVGSGNSEKPSHAEGAETRPGPRLTVRRYLGPCFAGVAQRWDFPNGGWAEIEFRLAPGWRHIEITERHQNAPGWTFDLAAGWTPTTGLGRPFTRGGPGSGSVPKPIEADRPLLPGAIPFQDPSIFIELLPRWNQHFKDGWSFAASDGAQAVGVLPVRASRWFWPHDSVIAVRVRAAGDQALLDLPGRHGQRQWWLRAAPVADWADPGLKEYVTANWLEHPDRLNRDFDLPADPAAVFRGEWPFADSINPTGAMRSRAKGMLAQLAAGPLKPGDDGLYTNTQAMLHPDCYGSMYAHWSPENPNFFSDFIKVPILQAIRLKDRPGFAAIRAQCEARLREDMDFSVTLPGGAGQECPGYQNGGIGVWASLAPICREHLGFDPTTWPRFAAAKAFQLRLSQPDGAIRRMLPMGDTHPDRVAPDKTGGGPKPVAVEPAVAQTWISEEFPGFGVVMRHRSGTPQETYLSFKAGPNRGHYHGDQLAIHLCLGAVPTAVDHFCSYHPRAGQEHMHNRLAFSTPDLPWANLDGYERLIAWQPGPAADIAVAQVESPRLRAVRDLPPENWDQRWPVLPLSRPLVYRRTVILLKGAQDAVVLRDQWRGGDPQISATYCLHVHAETCVEDGPRVRFGEALVAHRLIPATAAFTPFPWSHDNGGGEKSQGLRWTAVTGKVSPVGEKMSAAGADAAYGGEFVTVLAKPGVEARVFPDGFQVGDATLIFNDAIGSAGVVVRRAGQEIARLDDAAVDLGRHQGEVGLFIPDAGYPFGPIPDWLIKQRDLAPPVK
ncbi:hypothetical protein LBMAG53_39330 [Planctomycetota bacterium]|nr:hypothetical protein LBMAG53_39330 [Planctomycetota bacterium]